MDNVLTLISNPKNGGIPPTTVHDVCTLLHQNGTHTTAPDWLSQNEAVDIGFSHMSCADVLTLTATVLQDKPIDAIAQSSYRRRKKVLIADMDSTIVKGETLDDLADFAGLKDEITAITKRAMKGELNFAEALHTRVGMLKGLDESYLCKTLSAIQLTAGAKTLVHTMRANGAFTALISGGFSYFTDRIREQVGFHTSLGNQLEIKNGELTGKVIPPIVSQHTKQEMLIDIATQQGVSLANTLTIGDGANDVPMLTKAGIGIAFHAHPVARDAAPARLDYNDLTGALFAQGYKRKDFVI